MTPAEVLRSIGGAQAQEPRAGRLQLRVRARGLTAAGIEHARVEERSILRTWLMRKTIHLIPTDDYGWLASLFNERTATWSRRRLEILGVPARTTDRALSACRGALTDRGPLPRSELVAVAAGAGMEVSVETRTHLAVLLVATGIAVIGPDSGRESVLALTADWIGRPELREREDALAELARRYLAAFAPASERDFAYWAGLPLTECKLGLAGIAGELKEMSVGGETLLAPKAFGARPPRSTVVRLLGAFDTYLMGYASRAHAVDLEDGRRILPGGGVLRPTICVDGRFVGTWSSQRSGRKLRVSLDPFDRVDEAWLDRIDAEVADLGRFEGLEARLD